MKRTKYASDISKEKFAEIEPLLRSVRRSTKPTTIDLYEVFCAVLYLLRTGCQWRFLPGEFPKWQSVYAYWRKWNEPAPARRERAGAGIKKIRLARPERNWGATLAARS